VTGDGMGPAAGVTLASGERIDYLNPRPRDYRLGKFKFTSTPRGYKPRRSDLARIIRYGAKGTSMPAFRWLGEDDVEALIDYVILLSQRGELEKMLIDEAEFELEEEDDFDPEYVAEYVTDIQASWEEATDNVVLPVTRRPPYTDESILAGRQIYLDRACAKCHGQDGRGNPEENVGKDDWGQTAYAADLSAGMLHGGRRPVDIYRRIFAGITGTPMPAFGDALADQPETMWHLVHYIMSIVENREVEGLDQVQPTITTDPLSADATGGSGSGGADATGDDTTETDTAEETNEGEEVDSSGE
jgi:mono/diheme cytochrome c family protein